MPKRPQVRNVRWHGRQYWFRAKLGGQSIARPLGADLTEARRLAFLYRQELIVKRVEGVKLPGTVAEFADTWIKQYVLVHRSKNQKKAESMARTRLREYILPTIGHLRLSDVRRANLEDLATLLRDRKLSVMTQRHVLSDCRCMLNFAVDLEILDSSPFSGRRRILPRAPKRKPQPIRDADLKRILELCPEPYRSCIILAARTGTRWGELKNLTWDCVALAGDPALDLRDTKVGDRRIPLDAECVAILERWKEQWKADAHATPYVMPWRPVSPRAPVRLTAGVVTWHWHQLRHWYACDFLRRGGSIMALSKLLGHTSVKTTEIYAELSESLVRREFFRVAGQTELANELAALTSSNVLSYSAA